MKNSFVISVFLLITSVSCLSVEFPFRTWTSTSGVRIEARLIGKSGDKLTIERSDLKQFVLPLSLVSKADQNYVRAALMGPPLLSIGQGVRPSFNQVGAKPDSASLPIWSPTVIDKWWLTHADGDWNELSVKLMADLRSIWTTKEKRSLREG